MFNFQKCRGCAELDIGFWNVPFTDGRTIQDPVYHPRCNKGVFYTDESGLYIEKPDACPRADETVHYETIKITNCSDCPYCKTGMTFGNDGRDGKTVYICERGAFGKRDAVEYYGFSGYSIGPVTIPKYPPTKCPIIKTPLVKIIASKLDISEFKLQKVLDEENCEIKLK